MRHIFISYSRRDQVFAEKLADDLIASGFKVWIDRTLQAGDQWERSIEQNLENAQDVVLILSHNSLKSEWARHEGSMSYALKKPISPP
jgi:hypothetical protein